MNAIRKTTAWIGVITIMVGLITILPHSALAKHYDSNNNSYSYTSTQYSSNNDGQSHYNNGYTAGWYKAQSDWNNNVYSAASGGNPNQGCTKHHTQEYCNGFYDGYTKLWTQWQYNLAHGLNLVNSPDQTQGSHVSTNIKGNNNHVTNVINQNQAANSGNGGDTGTGSGNDLPTCLWL